ncbi:MAG TPA: hypothetical protein VIU12_17555 [Chryseolinea sp.]
MFAAADDRALSSYINFEDDEESDTEMDGDEESEIPIPPCHPPLQDEHKRNHSEMGWVLKKINLLLHELKPTASEERVLMQLNQKIRNWNQRVKLGEYVDPNGQTRRGVITDEEAVQRRPKYPSELGTVPVAAMKSIWQEAIKERNPLATAAAERQLWNLCLEHQLPLGWAMNPFNPEYQHYPTVREVEHAYVIRTGCNPSTGTKLVDGQIPDLTEPSGVGPTSAGGPTSTTHTAVPMYPDRQNYSDWNSMKGNGQSRVRFSGLEVTKQIRPGYTDMGELIAGMKEVKIMGKATRQFVVQNKQGEYQIKGESECGGKLVYESMIKEQKDAFQAENISIDALKNIFDPTKPYTLKLVATGRCGSFPKRKPKMYCKICFAAKDGKNSSALITRSQLREVIGGVSGDNMIKQWAARGAGIPDEETADLDLWDLIQGQNPWLQPTKDNQMTLYPPQSSRFRQPFATQPVNFTQPSTFTSPPSFATQAAFGQPPNFAPRTAYGQPPLTAQTPTVTQQPTSAQPQPPAFAQPSTIAPQRQPPTSAHLQPPAFAQPSTFAQPQPPTPGHPQPPTFAQPSAFAQSTFVQPQPPSLAHPQPRTFARPSPFTQATGQSQALMPWQQTQFASDAQWQVPSLPQSAPSMSLNHPSLLSSIQLLRDPQIIHALQQVLAHQQQQQQQAQQQSLQLYPHTGLPLSTVIA